MLRRLLIGSCLALLLGTPVVAQEDFARPGFYVGVSGTTAVYTKLNDQLGSVPEQIFEIPPSGQPQVPIKADPSLGVHARAGYRFMPRLAAEAHLEYASGSEIYAPTFRWQTDIVKLTALTVTGDLKGYITTGMVQPFALVGIGWMKTYGEDKRIDPAEAFGRDIGNPQNPDSAIPMAQELDVDDSGFVGRFGGGVDIYVSQHVSLGAAASYVLPFGSWDTFDYDYISIDWGLQYRF